MGTVVKFTDDKIVQRCQVCPFKLHLGSIELLGDQGHLAECLHQHEVVEGTYKPGLINVLLLDTVVCCALAIGNNGVG